MKRAMRFAIIPVALAGMILTFSCSDSEHRIPFGYARAVINLNLPPETPDAQAGLIERVRRFLVPDAIAQSAPASFSSINVRVTGPDMALIEESFAPYSTISLSVPSGALRIFEVTAYVAPGDPSAAASFRGTSSANCPAGATVSIPVVMGLNETKIIVPDYYNYRIVSTTNLAGDSWINLASLPGVATLLPSDIDFDSRGRMYIANYSNPGIIRIDNMNGDNIIISDSGHFGNYSNILFVAIDRIDNFVYFSTNSNLYRSRLDGTETQALTLPGSPVPIEYIRGLGMDNAGHLYIAGDEVMSSQFRVYKYRVEGTTLTLLGTPLDSANLSYPSDVMVRGSSIYVANPSGPAGYMILRVIEGPGEILQIAEHYGIQGSTSDRGVFYSPNRFLAIRNDSLIIADSRTFSLAKLISMDDMNGSGWTTFGTYGPGVNQFRLWAFC